MTYPTHCYPFDETCSICNPPLTPNPDDRRDETRGWAELADTPLTDKQIERIKPVWRELAEKAGEHGVTASDVRIVAQQRNILTGEEKGRELSYLPSAARRAGLIPTDRTRRSTIKKSHGNRHTIWTLPEFAKKFSLHDADLS